MIWGATWSWGFRILVRIRNSVEGPAYQALLNMLPICDEDFLMLQDNLPPHKAASTMSFLEENGVFVVLRLATSLTRPECH